MHTGVAHLLGPGQEPIVQLGEAGDAVRLGLREKTFADEAIEALLLAASLGRVGSAMDQPDTQHRTTPLERGMPVWTTVIHIQPFRQAAALDGRAQHVLAGARVLVGDPAAVDEQPRVIVDQHEQVGALAAAGAWVRHEWTNQHVADPYLIRSVSLEATECTWLAGQGRTLEATALEMLANGPLGNADAMAGEENGANLSGRASRQLDPQGAHLVKELGVAADGAQVSTRVGLEAIQALLAIGANPAVECAARVLPLAAVGMLVQLARQLAHQLPAVGGTEPWTNGFGNDAVAEQGD